MVKGTYIGSGLNFMTKGKSYNFVELHETYVMVKADDGEYVFLIKEDFDDVRYTQE